jgi:carbon-monoxide dehydrogenase medium subunit
MYAASFEYHDPATVRDAVTLLRQHGGNARLLAGGQSLIPLMKLRLASPPVIVDLGRVKELTGIREEAGTLVIGAMTTHHAVATSALVRDRAPLLAQAAAAIGDVQVRNRGTIGGSVAHADPAADWPAALLALDASMAITGAADRTVAAGDFFVDLMTTAIEPGEILTAIRVPVPTGRGVYEKVRQPASGFALVGIAVQIAVESGVCRAAALGVTGVAAAPYRATAVEHLLTGKSLNDPAIAAAAARIAEGVEPLSDMHASGEFRAHLAAVHAARAIAAAARA